MKYTPSEFVKLLRDRPRMMVLDSRWITTDAWIGGMIATWSETDEKYNYRALNKFAAERLTGKDSQLIWPSLLLTKLGHTLQDNWVLEEPANTQMRIAVCDMVIDWLDSLAMEIET